MEFHNWYSKSVTEAHDRYKKEEEDKQAITKEKASNEKLENDYYDMNYGSINIDEDDLLRLDDDGGWVGL